MSVIDIMPVIRKYEMGEVMTSDEKELLTAGLYFFYRAYEQMRKSPRGSGKLAVLDPDEWENSGYDPKDDYRK